MNKKNKKVNDSNSQVNWFDWFEHYELYSSYNSLQTKRFAKVLRSRVVLLFYRDVLDITKTLELLNNQLSQQDVSINKYWFGAKNPIKKDGTSHSHLLLELYSCKPAIYVRHEVFSVTFPNGEILHPLAIEHKLRSLSKIKQYILRHSINDTNEDENFIEKANVLERWSQIRVVVKRKL